jgi:lipopolysaccharide/colanic/teichoic acid biosynthesis glycosyltransferase
VAAVSEDVAYRRSKRTLDATVSAGLLILTAPVFGLACVAMGIDMLLSRRDRGPWLYREQRVSAGRVFELLKLRTLTLEALATQVGAEKHARLLEADPRNLTWAGRTFLKRWYLDELPQLVNILRGDMSLVGPRPWPLAMVEEQVASGLDYRNRAVAGWTGPAQVQKGSVETARYTDLDLRYVQACRTWRPLPLVRYDLSILAETLKVLVRGEGLRY